MNDLFGVPIKEKREVKPPAVHLRAQVWDVVCTRLDVKTTDELDKTTCLQCLARVNADRKRAEGMYPPCPSCKSRNIRREKCPNGKTWCGDCGYEITEF